MFESFGLDNGPGYPKISQDLSALLLTGKKDKRMVIPMGMYPQLEFLATTTVRKSRHLKFKH